MRFAVAIKAFRMVANLGDLVTCREMGREEGGKGRLGSQGTLDGTMVTDSTGVGQMGVGAGESRGRKLGGKPRREGAESAVKPGDSIRAGIKLSIEGLLELNHPAKDGAPKTRAETCGGSEWGVARAVN